MKIILTNADIVLKKEKQYVDFALSYWSINANTGVMTAVDYNNQYAKIGPLRKLSVAQDGVNILPNIGAGVSDDYYVYLYDSNGDYIGYGQTILHQEMVDGILIENVLSVPNTYSNQGVQIDKETAIANTAYYMVALAKIESFASLDGKSLKIR